MLCGLGFHRPGLRPVWNAGIGFSKCTRCGREMIRRAGRSWTLVPRGQVVIWRNTDPEPTRRDEPAGNRYRSDRSQVANEPGSPVIANTVEPAPDGRDFVRPFPAPWESRVQDRTEDDTGQRREGISSGWSGDPPFSPSPVPPSPETHAQGARLREKMMGGWPRPAGSGELPSLAFRHLARRIGTAQSDGRRTGTILLSALCDAESANDTMLMFAAMLQDELGGRLLVIDATLRDDGIGRALGMARAPGLSDARADAPDAVLEMIQLLPRRSVYLLPAGRRPDTSDPATLPALLPLLSRRFDHILIQQHAVFADTRYLPSAAAADLVILLAEEGSSRMRDLARCRDTLRANAIDRVGLLLALPSARLAA